MQKNQIAHNLLEYILTSFSKSAEPMMTRIEVHV